MSNEHQRRLMQEALDQELNAEALHVLRQELDTNPGAASEFARLRRVDDLFRNAPMERASERLALKIMERIAASVETEDMSQETRRTLAVGVALLMVVAVPLLTSALGLYLLAAGNPAMLAALIQQIVALLAAVVAMLEAFVRGAEEALREYPEAPALLAGLIPMTTYVLLRLMWMKEYGGRAHDAG
jgi:anti-sigma factor RsiW